MALEAYQILGVPVGREIFPDEGLPRILIRYMWYAPMVDIRNNTIGFEIFHY